MVSAAEYLFCFYGSVFFVGQALVTRWSRLGIFRLYNTRNSIFPDIAKAAHHGRPFSTKKSPRQRISPMPGASIVLLLCCCVGRGSRCLLLCCHLLSEKAHCRTGHTCNHLITVRSPGCIVRIIDFRHAVAGDTGQCNLSKCAPKAYLLTCTIVYCQHNIITSFYNFL